MTDISTLEENMEESNLKRKEILNIYEVFKPIFSKAPLILKDLTSSSVDIDYKKFVEDQIDFNKINAKFKDEKYNSVTDAITDIRHVFLNCYKYYGTRSNHTLESLKIEELFEQKISCLDENLKLLADIKMTFNILKMDGKPISKFRYPKNCYDSVLLRCVAHCRSERLKDYNKILSTTLTTDEDNAHSLEEVISWENENNFYEQIQYINSMWKLPEIGNFVAILFKKFGFEIVNQGEIERMFLMPKESQTMGKILTILLMPLKKNKSSDEILPYQIWSEKLNIKVSEWFKIYHHQKKNKVRVLALLGIHPDFWTAIGDTNPLNKYDYCELSYSMKVWLVKGLCDYITVKYKTISNIVLNCNERQCTIWKNDMATEEYFYFNSMPDLRVYYYNIPYDEPSLDFLESEKDNEEKRVDDKHNDVLIPSISNAKSQAKPNETNFKLIADSVQGLRSFLDELGSDDSVPENLINALEDFIDKIEPKECNYIVLNNNSKIKLFKDCKSYLERSKNDKDILSTRENKKIKSSEDLSGRIIFGKRKRKPVIMQEFYQEYLNFDDFDSGSSGNVNTVQIKSENIKVENIKEENDMGENFETPQIKSENIKVESIMGENLVDDLNEESNDYNDIYMPLIDSRKEENKNPLTANKQKYVENNEVTNEQSVQEIIVLDDSSEESRDIDEQNNSKKDNSSELKRNDEVIVLSDDEEVQITSMNSMAKNITNQMNGYCTIRNNLNKSQNLVPKRRQMVTANRIQSNWNMPKLSPNISIMPANIHIPKGIQVIPIRKPQTLLPRYFNATKRSYTQNPSIVNVECRVISKQNFDGELKFYVDLPNGKLHPVSDELINEYLKTHNNVLPDYWLVPLSVEVAKQYGFKI